MKHKARAIIRNAYGWGIGLTALLCLAVRGGAFRDAGIKLYYGGAKAGYRGGPQVKVSLLQSFFSSTIFRFNTLYLLSGALYIPPVFLRALKKMGVRIVLNQNGVFYPAWYPNDWRAENDRMAKAMDCADYVFYQSRFCKDCADHFLQSTAQKYEILFNGVDTDVFSPREHTDRKNGFIFLITGNIGPSTYYRLLNALDALALAKANGLDVYIHFYGVLPDDLRSDFLHQIQTNGMENFFYVGGSYTREEAPEIFHRGDAYLMTKHNDPCPNVVLEAMASGLPILFSKSGGVPELVGDDAGIGINVRQSFDEDVVPSAQDIVDGMKQLIGRYDVLSRNARARAVDVLGIPHWIERHRAVFSELRAGVFE